MTERELSIEEACNRLTRLNERLGLHAKITFPKERGLVATCQLYDKNFYEVSSGAGKGEHCEVGALAESLEHYFMEAVTPTKVPGNELLKRIEPYDDWLIKSIPAYLEIPCFRFEALSRNEEIDIPAILMAPSPQNIANIEKTSANFLTKYATNSGMALGCTENEALLHAINEAIERHALSLHYLSLCGFAAPPEFYRPSPSFLEDTFGHDGELLRHAKKLDIFLSHAFYDVPFCIAVSKPTKRHALCNVGSGCSINPSTAMYRAVTEHLQCQQLHSTVEKQEDRNALKMLTQSKRLATLLHPCPTYAVPTLHPTSSNISIRGQIKRTLINLENHQKTIFSRTLFTDPGLATVVQVYIPGLERFHLIRSGIPVAPQSIFKGKGQ
jgi:ribosomal protein S12 methylthiotransferase accessory factor